jgi:hypothetical protein
VHADEGWLYGQCSGRVGVFPAGFAIKFEDTLPTNQQDSLLQQSTNDTRSLKGIAITDYNAVQSNHLSFRKGDVILLRDQKDKFWSGELNGKIGWLPADSIRIDDGFNNSTINSSVASSDLSKIKNYHIAVYAYASDEVGDLNFQEFEIINVTDINDQWFTGYVAGSGTDEFTNPLRSGIFPSNFVTKFNIPIDYIGKYQIAMAVENYTASNNGELTVSTESSQLIAIKKISPDEKYFFGEIFVSSCSY